MNFAPTREGPGTFTKSGCGNIETDTNYVIYSTAILGEAHFSVEQIIHCIRVSENPQTHHHALSLLAIGAKHFPVSVFC